MPELPEVETIARGVRRAGVIGRRICRVDVRWPRTVAPQRPAEFAAAVTGRTLAGLRRRAKYLLWMLEDGSAVLAHLRMTGRISLVAAGAPVDGHVRLRMTLDDGREVRFTDTRKFGRWRHVPRWPDAVARLGPEPLARTFTPAILGAALRGRRRQLKPLLLDQRIVAGLGNIYVDEALWQARLHPRRRAATLRPADIAALHAAIRDVLRAGIRHGGTSLGGGRTNYAGADERRGRHQEHLRVFARTGKPCPRCGAGIRKIAVAQRGTHLCPRCQRAPRRSVSRES